MTPRLLATMTHDLPEEDQLVVYDAKGSQLVVLNLVGAAIYHLINGHRSARQIADFLREATPGGAPSTCQADVDAFLKQLESHGVVSLHSS